MKNWTASALVQTLLAFTLLIFATLVPVSFAQAQEPGVSQIDVVLLLDQSLSIQQSDPDSIRHEAARFARQWAEQILSEYDNKEAKLSINLGIIFFGASPRIILPLQPVGKLASTDLDALNLVMQQLDESARRFDGVRLTEYGPALKSATEILAAAQSVNNEKRLQRLIVVSDGIPDTEDVARQAQSSLGDLTEAYATALRDAFENIAPENVYLMRVPATPASIWRQVEPAWQEMIGKNHVLIVSDIQTMGSELQQILGAIVEETGILSDERLTCGPLEMPPYVDTAYFTVHKPTPNTRIRLQDTLGRDVAQGDWKATVDGSVAETSVIGNQEGFIESIAVFNPVPGPWQVLCPSNFAGDVPIYWRTSLLHGDIQVDPVYVGIPSRITYQVLARDGSPLPGYEREAEPLAVNLSVSGGEQPLQTTLLRDPGSNRYQALVTLPPEATLQVGVDLPLAAGALESLNRSIVLQPVFYRWQADGALAQFATSPIAIELVNQQGESLSIPPAIIERLELHLSADNGVDAVLSPVANSNRPIFQGAAVFGSGGAHNIVVVLNNLSPAGTTNLEPWNGNNQIDVYPPRLIRADDKPVPIFIPSRVALKPVNHNNQPLPPDVLDYSATGVRGRVSGSVFALLAAEWIPEEGIYRQLVWPFIWSPSVIMLVDWNLPGINTQVAGPIQIPLTTTTILESPQEYILYIVGLVALLVLWFLWRAQSKDRRENIPEPGGYLTLISWTGEVLDTIEPDRGRRYIWPVKDGAGGVKEVRVLQQETDDGSIEMLVTVEATNGSILWPEYSIRNDERIDIGRRAQLLRSETKYIGSVPGSSPRSGGTIPRPE